jgi:prophage regulatory protein
VIKMPEKVTANLGELVKSTRGLLRPASTCDYLDISRSGLHRLSENDPTFPRKIVLSKRCVGYRTEALDAWLAFKESSL